MQYIMNRSDHVIHQPPDKIQMLMRLVSNSLVESYSFYSQIYIVLCARVYAIKLILHFLNKMDYLKTSLKRIFYIYLPCNKLRNFSLTK